ERAPLRVAAKRKSLVPDRAFRGVLLALAALLPRILATLGRSLCSGWPRARRAGVRVHGDDGEQRFGLRRGAAHTVAGIVPDSSQHGDVGLHRAKHDLWEQ